MVNYGMFGAEGLSEGSSLAAVWSIVIQSQYTHMQMHTYTSAEANPGGLSPLFEIPGSFLRLFPK